MLISCCSLHGDNRSTLLGCRHFALGCLTTKPALVTAQAVKAGDVQTFERELDKNMYTFCAQVGFHVPAYQTNPFSASITLNW